MNKIKALIVDDERLARKDLISLLSEFNNISVVKEVDNITSAKNAIEKYKPDVVFLDIQMPGESGFDLISQINTNAKIIFVTAFDEFAIRAFEVNALDYLLKPINPERLREAINRLEKSTEINNLNILNYDDHLLLNINSNLRFIKINSIVTISSAGDYSSILTSDKKKGLTLKTLKEWETRLPEKHFCRIHRSHIINLNYLDRLEEWFKNSYKVYMKNMSEPLEMSRRYVSKLKDQLG